MSTKTKEVVPSTSMMVIADSIKKKASPLIRQAEDISITTKDEYEQAGKLVSQLKEYSKEAERQEKTLTEPAKSIIKSAMDIFRPFRTRVAEIEGMVKIRMIEYRARQENESRKLEQKFADGTIKKVSTLVAKQNELLDTSSEFAQVRKIWTLTITDAKKIPAKYLVPDEVAIKNALRAGEKIPGTRWEQVNSIAI